MTKILVRIGAFGREGSRRCIHCPARSTSYCPDAGVSRFPIDRIMLACEGESV